MSVAKITRIDHSSAIAKYAAARNIDTTTAGKRFRAKLRSSFDTISAKDAANYGAKGKVKTHANDKRPWTDHRTDVLAELFPGTF